MAAQDLAATLAFTAAVAQDAPATMRAVMLARMEAGHYRFPGQEWVKVPHAENACAELGDFGNYCEGLVEAGELTMDQARSLVAKAGVLWEDLAAAFESKHSGG